MVGGWRFLVLAALLAGSPAGGAVIDVFPGPGALQAAIDAASDGDMLRVNGGTYAEAITIDKRLRVRRGPDPVIIDAGCSAAAAIAIAADRVNLSDLTVRGGTFFAIDIQQRDRVTVRGMVIQETCGTAEYGVNVFASDHVSLQNNQAGLFNDAGYYIGGIPDGARVSVRKNSAANNTYGILVEDSVASVRVQWNDVGIGNGTGIFLHNADRITVLRNTVSFNTGAGIEVDATSDDNRLTRNVLTGNGIDVVDNGSSNCWRGNEFASGTVPTDGCP